MCDQVASHAGVFRGACFSSLSQHKRVPLNMKMTEGWGEIQGKLDVVRVNGVLLYYFSLQFVVVSGYGLISIPACETKAEKGDCSVLYFSRKILLQVYIFFYQDTSFMKFRSNVPPYPGRLTLKDRVFSCARGFRLPVVVSARSLASRLCI